MSNWYATVEDPISHAPGLNGRLCLAVGPLASKEDAERYQPMVRRYIDEHYERAWFWRTGIALVDADKKGKLNDLLIERW